MKIKIIDIFISEHTIPTTTFFHSFPSSSLLGTFLYPLPLNNSAFSSISSHRFTFTGLSELGHPCPTHMCPGPCVLFSYGHHNCISMITYVNTGLVSIFSDINSNSTGNVIVVTVCISCAWNTDQLHQGVQSANIKAVSVSH